MSEPLKKKLFYGVASWLTEPRGKTDVYIRHVYGAVSNEAEARGRMMEWLDANYPEYKEGSKFSLFVVEIPDNVIRQCL